MVIRPDLRLLFCRRNSAEEDYNPGHADGRQPEPLSLQPILSPFPLGPIKCRLSDLEFLISRLAWQVEHEVAITLWNGLAIDNRHLYTYNDGV